MDLEHHEIPIIFIWTGSEASLDKIGSAAIHALALKNQISASSPARVIRIQEKEESAEFSACFPKSLSVISKSHVDSGGFSAANNTPSLPMDLDPPTRPVRVWRFIGKFHFLLQLMPPSQQSLESNFVYIIDTLQVIVVWCGSSCKSNHQHRAKFLAKHHFASSIERDKRARVEVVVTHQNEFPPLHPFIPSTLQNSGHYSSEASFQLDSILSNECLEPVDYRKTARLALYCVIFSNHGSNADENNGPRFRATELHRIFPLPDLKNNRSSIFHSSASILVDFHGEVVVWIGSRCGDLMKQAALTLAHELLTVVQRPVWACLSLCRQHLEPEWFKLQFPHWEPINDQTPTNVNFAPNGAGHRFITSQLNDCQENLAQALKVADSKARQTVSDDYAIKFHEVNQQALVKLLVLNYWDFSWNFHLVFRDGEESFHHDFWSIAGNIPLSFVFGVSVQLWNHRRIKHRPPSLRCIFLGGTGCGRGRVGVF